MICPPHITVVIPTLDAAEWIDDCLAGIFAQHPSQVIVVDGGSQDDTRVRAAAAGATVMEHGGAGPAAARQVGIQQALSRWVALVDADIVLPDGAFDTMVMEAMRRGLEAISAGFVNESEGDYWGSQLARHHNRGRSRHWFGTAVAILRLDTLRAHPFDVRLASGEDIDLRLRLERAGVPIGVAEQVQVRHRYGRGWHTAVGQWTADGAGLGRLVRKDGLAAVHWAMLPLGAAALGTARSIRDGFDTLPYYAGHAAGNVVGLIVGLTDRRIPLGPNGGRGVLAVLAAVWSIGVVAIVVPFAVLRTFAAVIPQVARDSTTSDLLPLVTLAFVVLLVVREVDAARGRPRHPRLDIAMRIAILVGVALGIGALLRMAAILGLTS